MKVSKKILRRDHEDALKINAKNDLLKQFHSQGLTQQQLMSSRPENVVRVTGQIVTCGKRNQYVRGDSYKIRNPRGANEMRSELRA